MFNTLFLRLFYFILLIIVFHLLLIHLSFFLDIENTSWKVLAYGIYARVVDVSEIERVSEANE